MTFTATRDQLVDAIAGLQVDVATSGPAKGLILAESMADAIIAALADQQQRACQITVYAPSLAVYGLCMSCRRERWETERHDGPGPSGKRSMHCGCCTHPHDLAPGFHALQAGSRP